MVRRPYDRFAGLASGTGQGSEFPLPIVNDIKNWPFNFWTSFEFQMMKNSTHKKFEVLPPNHPVLRACREGDEAAVRDYLEEGGNPWAISDKDDMNLVSLASLFQQIGLLKQFLEFGIDPNQPVGTADRRLLHAAATYARIDQVKLLLQHGADPNLGDTWGFTPLHECVEQPAVVKILLEGGADPLVQQRQGINPLHNAAARGSVESMALLVEAGVPINIPLKNGTTPLHKAAAAGRRDTCAWLLEHGADPTIVNRNGRTPAEAARSCEHFEVGDFIDEFASRK